MAFSKRMTTKDGREFYKIRVHVSADKPELTMRWYVPDGWSQKAIDRELAKVSAEFERKCKAGEVLSRADRKAQQEAAEQEAAKIQTVRQYGERVFMPAKKITVSENTRDNFQRALNNHIYPALGDKKLPEVTSADITAFFLSKQEDGLSIASVIKLYTITNLLFKMAYLDDTIDRNPMDKVQRPRPRKDEKGGAEVEAFTAEELKYILSCMDNEPVKWQAMIRLMIDTGIRRGEACALRWESIDFATNTATISGNLCYTKAKGVYLDTPKSGKTRDVYFSAATAKLLKRLQDEQKEDAQRRAARLTKEGKPLDLMKVAIPEFVFTEKGYCTPMHPQSPGRYLAKFGDRYGVEIHPHKLRHSFASVAITNGADIASVSEVLGHADKSTTLRMYTHANEESKRRAASIVLEAIGQG